jgi:hypothetical protein
MGGGRWQKNEQWKYKVQTIVTVESYKYLGVLSSFWSIKPHLNEKKMDKGINGAPKSENTSITNR